MHQINSFGANMFDVAYSLIVILDVRLNFLERANVFWDLFASFFFRIYFISVIEVVFFVFRFLFGFSCVNKWCFCLRGMKTVP